MLAGMPENIPIPADTLQDKNTTPLSPTSEKSDHTMRQLVFAIATTAEVVMVNIAYEHLSSSLKCSIMVIKSMTRCRRAEVKAKNKSAHKHSNT
jgi:hypothetical protein